MENENKEQSVKEAEVHDLKVSMLHDTEVNDRIFKNLDEDVPRYDLWRGVCENPF